MHSVDDVVRLIHSTANDLCFRLRVLAGRGVELLKQRPVVRRHRGQNDETFPANAMVSERKSVEEAKMFVGLEK
ncbi:hypothetical protein ACM43_25400 [Bradyrhizobium sp. CCBAU 45321]|nr:hypothetical protein [Bradyrhizobium sp. CCBAU 45321]